MDDPLCVGVAQSPGRLRRIEHHVTRGQRAVAPEDLAQALARHELHHNVKAAAGLIGVVGAHHVRVVEPPDELHLAPEPPHAPAVARHLWRDDLERHVAPHQQVPRLVHTPHRPSAQLVQNHVLPERQPMWLVFQQPRGLVFGQHAVAHQAAGQAMGIERQLTGEHPAPNLVDLRIGHDLRKAKHVQQVAGWCVIGGAALFGNGHGEDGPVREESRIQRHLAVKEPASTH